MMYSTPGIALEPPVELRNPPVLNVKTEQVEGILDKLDQYWQRFALHFQRREQREWISRISNGGNCYYFPNEMKEDKIDHKDGWRVAVLWFCFVRGFAAVGCVVGVGRNELCKFNFSQTIITFIG